MRARLSLLRRPLVSLASACVFLLCCGGLLSQSVVGSAATEANEPTSAAAHLVPSQAHKRQAEQTIVNEGTETDMEQIQRRAKTHPAPILLREDQQEEDDVNVAPAAPAACTPQAYNFGSYDYCGASYFTPSTYPVPTAVSGSIWNLVQLQLLTRHGDRTPVNILPSYDVAYDFCDTTQTLGFMTPASAAAGSADAMGHTTRHGRAPKPNKRRVATAQEGRRLERIPILSAPSVSNPYASQLWQGSCMTGQLTTKGVEQLEALGGALHSIYVDQLGFLPKTYSRANTSFYLRSTDVWRTRQSAEALLTGLWPALDDLDTADVIPLHSFPAEIETMYANPIACDALASVELQQFQSSPWVDHLVAPEVWSVLNDVLGVGALPDWHQAYDHYVDNFRTRECHSLPLPCQPGNATNCIPAEVADFVYGQGDWEYQYLMNASPLATDLAQLGISAFMSVIRDVIVGTITGNTTVSSIGTPAFAYYSGHDTTLGAVLGFLNVTNFRWPPYASNMQFELWQSVPTGTSGPAATAANAGSSYSVRILYNGAVLPLYAAGCCDDMCPVESFLAYMDEMIPEDLVQVCQGDGIRKAIKHAR